MGGGKSLSDCILDTVRCRGCRCATSWSDIDLTFDLAVVTLTYKILSGVYLGNRKVQEVDAG